jgi:hypothetical protein
MKEEEQVNINSALSPWNCKHMKVPNSVVLKQNPTLLGRNRQTQCSDDQSYFAFSTPNLNLGHVDCERFSFIPLSSSSRTSGIVNDNSLPRTLQFYIVFPFPRFTTDAVFRTSLNRENINVAGMCVYMYIMNADFRNTKVAHVVTVIWCQRPTRTGKWTVKAALRRCVSLTRVACRCLLVHSVSTAHALHDMETGGGFRESYWISLSPEFGEFCSHVL